MGSHHTLLQRGSRHRTPTSTDLVGHVSILVTKSVPLRHQTMPTYVPPNSNAIENWPALEICFNESDGNGPR